MCWRTAEARRLPRRSYREWGGHRGRRRRRWRWRRDRSLSCDRTKPVDEIWGTTRLRCLASTRVLGLASYERSGQDWASHSPRLDSWRQTPMKLRRVLPPRAAQRHPFRPAGPSREQQRCSRCPPHWKQGRSFHPERSGHGLEAAAPPDAQIRAHCNVSTPRHRATTTL
eukprot:scaffold31501_cov32-Tisochrysis_lutea.AAC.3